MKLKDLEAKISAKVEEVKNFVADGKIEDAKKAKQELKDLQEQYDLLKDLDEDKKEDMKDKGNPLDIDQDKKDNVKKFANAARMGFRNMMTEGTPASGGYTVPEDINTRIQELRDAKFSLRSLVTVENVKTNKGSRTYKTRATQTGFAKVGEGGKIGKKAAPKFSRIDYNIEKYGGYFAVTDELLEDSDANIVSTLTKWIADESRVTDNNLILGVLKTKKAVAMTSLDDIKKAKNVTLGSAYNSKIVTNDDGFQWLDTLKDENGRYLLQPNPTDPTQYRIAGCEVKVVPNADLPTVDNKVPFIVGELTEAITLFDRKKTTIKASDVAATTDLNAFEEDLTLFRAIVREDVEIKDEKAYVYLELDQTV